VIEERATCHDCGVKEGEIHKYGCDMEACPFCGNQLITCGCYYKILDISDKVWVYKHGLTKEQERMWLIQLRWKGRIPYIQYPNICAKCGKLWPAMFDVPDAEWDKYVEPRMRGEMLCIECYKKIKKWIGGNENEGS